MASFETLLILLSAALVLLLIARRLALPYPSVLALAGGIVAFLPWGRRRAPPDTAPHSTVTLFARLRGLSTSVPLATAV
jgi:hypothetical protein